MKKFLIRLSDDSTVSVEADAFEVVPGGSVIFYKDGHGTAYFAHPASVTVQEQTQ